MKTTSYKNKLSLLDKLKAKSKREANIFFSLCEKDSEIISAKKFKNVLLNSGLKAKDKRLYNLFQNLDAHGDRIVFEDFIEIIRSSELIVEKALRGELSIPDFSYFAKNLDNMFDEVKKIKSGELASYIPPLANVDPDQFGVAIVTTDGQI